MFQPENLVITQFNFGQSNPTYKISFRDHSWNSSSTGDDDGTPGDDDGSPPIPTALVLRKKPNRIIHKSAHALDREFRILQYIHAYNQQQQQEQQQIPIPKPIVYCSDTNILQAEFYIMEYIQGRIFIDPSLPNLTPLERTVAYQDAVRILSNIHQIPFRIPLTTSTTSTVPSSLESLGPQGKYISRQVQRFRHVSQIQSQTFLTTTTFQQQNEDPIQQGTIANDFHELSQRLAFYSQHCPDSISFIHGVFILYIYVFIIISISLSPFVK